MLQTRIEAAQDSATLNEAQQARLIDLYRQSLSNLESIRASKEATEEFRQAARAAPAALEKIGRPMERWAAQGPVTNAEISAAATSSSLLAKLDEELAKRSAVDAKLAVLGARLESEALRPAYVRQRITAARGLDSSVSSALAATAGNCSRLPLPARPGRDAPRAGPGRGATAGPRSSPAPPLRYP